MRVILFISGLFLLPQLLFAQIPAAPVKIEKQDFKPGMCRFVLDFQADTGFAPVKSYVLIEDMISHRAVYHKNVSRIDTLIPDSAEITLNAWAPGFFLRDEMIGSGQHSPGHVFTDTITIPARHYDHSAATFYVVGPGKTPDVFFQFVKDYLQAAPGKVELQCYSDRPRAMSRREEMKYSRKFAKEIKKELARRGITGKTDVHAKRAPKIHPCGLSIAFLPEEEMMIMSYTIVMAVEY